MTWLSGAALIAAAENIARERHKNQFDKAGQPYIHHPERVAAAVAKEGASPEVIAAAWLHDVVEDSELTLAELAHPATGIPPFTIILVQDLTRPEGRVADPDLYYHRIRQNPFALQVKLADIRDNMDPQRLSLLPAELQSRLLGKYRHALSILVEDIPEADVTYTGPLVDSTPDDPASRPVLYVAGFALSHDRRYVLLIRKARPSWQRGKLNAVGGKVDPGETPRQAMAREFSEEAGVLTRPEHWGHFATLEFAGGSRVLFFRTILADDTMAGFDGVLSGPQPDEPIRLYPVKDEWEPASSTRMPNLSFLLPLAAYTHDQLDVVRVVETGMNRRQTS